MPMTPLGWLAALASALVLAIFLVTIAALRERRRGTTVRDVVLLVPDVLHLLLRLVRDRSLPNSVRLRIAAAVLYNVQPINVIPDFVPVIGFADNIAVILWAVRAVVRRCGDESLARNWPGSPERLALLIKFAGGPREPAPR